MVIIELLRFRTEDKIVFMKKTSKHDLDATDISIYGCS